MSIKNFSYGPSFWISVGLIALGILMLLENFDLFYYLFGIEIYEVWEFWPVILIVVGLAKMLNPKDRDIMSGIFVAAVGFMFLGMMMNWFHWGDIWQFWPIVLIFIGFRLLTNRNKEDSDGFKFTIEAHKESDWANMKNDRIDAGAVFGGRNIKISTQKFKGGNVVAIFGGVDAIFGDSKLAPGRNVMEVVAIFGGVDIYVPEDWKVVTKGMPIFGGFDDQRKNISNSGKEDEPVLEIRGVAIFGGVDIMNVKMKHLQ